MTVELQLGRHALVEDELHIDAVSVAQAQDIDALFGPFPDYRWNGQQESALRAQLYRAVRPIVGPSKLIEVTNTLLKLERV